MAVSIKPRFKTEDIKKAIAIRKQRIEDAIQLRLIKVGEQFVANARNKADFTDRTGNLRSSIGYIVMKNAKIIESNFEQRAGGPEGVEEARKVMEELKQKFPSGFVLIGVAGMDYAAAVESRGFDVITSSAIIAENALKAAIVKIGTKLKTA